jgi:ElaB/YqjD/DUF883 family membrane-anchored ribosome-binding protein
MDKATVDQLQERIDDLIVRVKSEYGGSELETQLNELKDRLEHTVINYPLKSLAVGLLAGFLIGKLFSDSND